MQQNTSDNACSLLTPTPPCTKFQSMNCDTCNRSFLSDKCYQNHLTLTVKSQLVRDCRRVCRNCSLWWLHILSLNVSRHSAISVTISSHQSVFATSLRSSLASFHTDLCTFCLIWNALKIFISVMDNSNSTEQYMCSANVFKVWSNWGLEYQLCTCGARVHLFCHDHIGKFIEFLRQCRKFADNLCVTRISHNYGGYDTRICGECLWNWDGYRISACCLRALFIYRDKIIFIRMYSYNPKRSFFMDVCT